MTFPSEERATAEQVLTSRIAHTLRVLRAGRKSCVKSLVAGGAFWARRLQRHPDMSNLEVRAHLLQRRRALLQRYREELERVEEELASRDIETVERATEEWDAGVLSRLGDVDMRSIVALTEAIARVDAGTYGHCVQCDQPIGPARLRALPEATTCISCASAAELPFARTA